MNEHKNEWIKVYIIQLFFLKQIISPKLKIYNFAKSFAGSNCTRSACCDSFELKGENLSF